MFQTLRKVLFLLKDRKKTVILLILANLIFTALLLLEPIFFRYVIDSIVALEKSLDTGEMTETLRNTLFLWCGVGLVIIALKLFVTIYADRMAHEEFNSVIRRYFTHTLSLSVWFHTDTNSGKLGKELVRWADNIFVIFLEFFRKLMPSVFAIILLIPYMLFLEWKLGLFVVVAGLISTLFALWATTKTFRNQQDIEKYYSDLSAHYIDTYSNILAVKSFTLREDRMHTLNTLLDDRLRLQYPVLRWWWLIISFSQIATVIITLGVIALGSYLYLYGHITLGQIVMFIGYSTIFLSSIEWVMWSLDTFFWRIPATKEFFETLETKASVTEAKDAKKLPRVKWDIRFEDVGFSYESDREILKKISLHIETGKKVAFVGHTWSGKTTATSLILRFYDIQSGRILIDWVDIRTVTEDSLRASIGVVFQDNSLFDATIRENIVLGEKKVSAKRLEEVIEKSHIKEFISRLPQWLDTLVGERWVKLSGGERQRLAIARAFLKDAPILILDEATSALDAETERYLQDSFEELMQDRTTIIIAHRLSTIRKADTIFVFRDGEIVEEGSYTTLVEKGGYFADLVRAQTDGFIEE